VRVRKYPVNNEESSQDFATLNAKSMCIYIPLIYLLGDYKYFQEGGNNRE